MILAYNQRIRRISMLKSARQATLAAVMVGALALSGCATTGSVKRAQASADQANQHADAVDAATKNAQSSADAAGAAAQRAQTTADGATTAIQATGTATQATNARVDALESRVQTLQHRVTQLQKGKKHRRHHRHHAAKPKPQAQAPVAAYQSPQ
jgi:outer membrane murein-binding lipoprotein Lpp